MAKKWQQRSCSSPKAKRHIQSRHWNSGWLDLCSSLLSSLELMPKQMLYLIFIFSFSRVRSTVASQLSTSLVSSERYFHRAVQSVQNLNCHFSLPWLHKQPICPSALLKVFWPEVHGNFRLGEKKCRLSYYHRYFGDVKFSPEITTFPEPFISIKTWGICSVSAIPIVLVTPLAQVWPCDVSIPGLWQDLCNSWWFVPGTSPAVLPGNSGINAPGAAGCSLGVRPSAVEPAEQILCADRHTLLK